MWAENGSFVHKLSSHEFVFMELWKKINEKFSVKDVEVVTYTMRRIWARRNSLIS